MDAQASQNHRDLIAKQWPAIENQLLLANAQLQAKKDAPLLSLSDVAKATVSGIAAQTGMNAAIVNHTTSPLGGILQSNALTGVISGAENVAREVLSGGAGAAGALTATGLDFPASDAVHPLIFLGEHPGALLARNLYRSNGFLGWKRIEQSANAQAYASVTGEGAVQYVVYMHDEQSGSVSSAFRVFKVSPAAFGSAVQAYTTMLGAAPRYASEGNVLRAVWESGAFVTADGQKLSAGWSHAVPQLFASAP